MQKAKFWIATEAGAIEVDGFKPTADSLMAIHDTHLGFDVTFIKTGTKVTSLFEKYRHDPAVLCARIMLFELKYAIQFCALLDLPWGCRSLPPEYAEVSAMLKEAAQA